MAVGIHPWILKGHWLDNFQVYPKIPTFRWNWSSKVGGVTQCEVDKVMKKDGCLDAEFN